MAEVRLGLIQDPVCWMRDGGAHQRHVALDPIVPIIAWGGRKMLRTRSIKDYGPLRESRRREHLG